MNKNKIEEKIANIKSLDIDELNDLAEDIRHILIDKMSKTGGHVGPNLGTVELTIALFKLFNFPHDKIVYDVSHQSYTHKILSGRLSNYVHGVEFDKLSGYTDPNESAYDNYTIGHTSTSIALAVGMAKARDLRGSDEKIIALIGDGSITGGMAMEALNNASIIKGNLIIILNDNDMSIAENHGGLYEHLRNLRNSNGELENNFFKNFGLDYRYIDDGNNIEAILKTFSEIKDINHPIIVHVNTLKGKGLKYAEENPEAWHWHAAFDKETGEYLDDSGEKGYGVYTSETLLEMMKNDSSIVAIAAGSPVSIGFSKEKRIKAGSQFVDVGIEEQMAVTLAAGLAKMGAKPVFGTSTSFIARALDQISHDVALNNLLVTIISCAASIYAMNDQTHLGIYDIANFSHIPNLVMMAPSSIEEYVATLSYAVNQDKAPIMIKMPGKIIHEEPRDYNFDNYKFEIIEQGNEIAILALGTFMTLGKELHHELKNHGINASLINPRFVTPIDEELLSNLSKSHNKIITLEDGILDGGFGEKISAFYAKSNIRVYNYGFKKEFIDQYDADEIVRKSGMTVENILKDLGI
ncbi:MAG: 1-deoxy-D-xylulose-5-phosphate synthase [Ezakiella sp.]|nr:1-deoxy-D-xylulose-5-phosphate synthase [Ezakiella sp.]